MQKSINISAENAYNILAEEQSAEIETYSQKKFNKSHSKKD